MSLAPHHQARIDASAISPEVAAARGYRTITEKLDLIALGFTQRGLSVPGLLIPIRGVDGELKTHQYRPDEPRATREGKPLKYESPKNSTNVLDVPPSIRPYLALPQSPLFVTEGTRKADSAASVGLTCISISGVFNWRGTNRQGGTTVLADWEFVHLKGRTVYLVFDSDISSKSHVRQALERLGRVLRFRGAIVHIVYLPSPNGDKVGLDDYLAAHGKDAFLGLVEQAKSIEADVPPPAPRPKPEPRTLSEAHAGFRRWFGPGYDLSALDAVLATAAAERLMGDPPWLLLVSGPGATKTETVQTLAGAGALVTSTIASEAALLSGTSRKDHTADATGGLLPRLGAHGILVIKDVTSLLSMNRDSRASLLAALREVHDGHWERNVGTDGGRSIPWRGRIVVVGAVTTAWDRAHDVIATMGDRFVLVRMDSTTGRVRAANQSCANTGGEDTMRAELAAVVGGVLETVNPQHTLMLTTDEQDQLVAAADIVTLSRTGVDYDYRGNVIDAHAPEMPTRFVKQLLQLMRGATAIGISRTEALRLAIRCARDSMPPLRLSILDDVAAHPHSRTADVRRRLAKPWTTVDRQLQSLYMLGVLTCDESEVGDKTIWRYSLAPHINPTVLRSDLSPDLSGGAHMHTGREHSTQRPESSNDNTASAHTDISGERLGSSSNVVDPECACVVCGRESCEDPSHVRDEEADIA